MCGIRRTVFLITAFAFAMSAQAQWRNLFPAFTGLTSGGGKFIAVSSDGIIMSSGNGQEWSQYFASGSLHSAAYGNDMFIVTQNNNSALTSSNGTDWEPELIGSATACRHLSFGGDLFVGVGDNGRTFRFDDDGWSNFSSSYDLSRVAFGGNRFVAVGDAIVSSSDGKGWGNRFDTQKSAIVYGDGKFIAYNSDNGSLHTSTNGTSWTSLTSNIPVGMASLTYGGGKFVAVGVGGSAAVSADGVSWTASTMNSADKFIEVKFDNGVFVALGAGGSVYTSGNGESWSLRAEGSRLSYRQIAYGGGRFMAVGDSGAMVSSDGKNWVRKDPPDGIGLESVAFGDGKFVTVSNKGLIFTTADNGESWREKTAGDTLAAVAYGGGRFVAIGKAMGFPFGVTSSDGITWTTLGMTGWNHSGVFPISLCFGDGKFWAGGSANRRFYSSTEGSFWSSVELPGETERVASITYAGGKFVAALADATGAKNKIIASDNGVQWNQFTIPQGTVKSAVYAKGHYIAVGDSGRIFTSSTGQDWGQQGMVTNRNLQTVFAEDTIFLAAGASGTMLYLTGNTISVRHTSSRNAKPMTAGSMSVDIRQKAPMLSLSFVPEKPGTIAFYSLSGRQLYTKRLKAGEKSVTLPWRVVSNGMVIARYTGGGHTIVQRFQFTK
ncbi:MAG: hypothetical protein LBI42_00035 [Chitinispirillales bacterium]|nr:hypothetical protein [Chitinispirillales bacterium]